MEISVVHLNDFYSLDMGKFGIELSFSEACEIRRQLAMILQGKPFFNNHPDDDETTVPTYVSVEESDQGNDICFGVDHCFWRLDRDESERLLDALDSALMASE